MSETTMTEAQRADILFGATSPRPTQPPASNLSAADRLFGGSCVTEAEAAMGVREKVRYMPDSPFGPTGRLQDDLREFAHLREGPPPLGANQRQGADQQQAKPSQHDENVARDLGQTVRELGLDDISAEHVQEAAKALGLQTPEQVEKVVELYDSFVSQQADAWRAETEQTLSRQAMRNAAAVVQYIGDKELVDYLNLSGMGDNPHLVRAFSKLGRLLRDEGLI